MGKWSTSSPSTVTTALSCFGALVRVTVRVWVWVWVWVVARSPGEAASKRMV